MHEHKNARFETTRRGRQEGMGRGRKDLKRSLKRLRRVAIYKLKLDSAGRQFDSRQ